MSAEHHNNKSKPVTEERKAEMEKGMTSLRTIKNTTNNALLGLSSAIEQEEPYKDQFSSEEVAKVLERIQLNFDNRVLSFDDFAKDVLGKGMYILYGIYAKGEKNISGFSGEQEHAFKYHHLMFLPTDKDKTSLVEVERGDFARRKLLEIDKVMKQQAKIKTAILSSHLNGLGQMSGTTFTTNKDLYDTIMLAYMIRRAEKLLNEARMQNKSNTDGENRLKVIKSSYKPGTPIDLNALRTSLGIPNI